MPVRAGFNTVVQIGGTPTTLTAEPTTYLSSGDDVAHFQITDAAKRVLDPTEAVTITLDGNPVSDAAIVGIDYYVGRVDLDEGILGALTAANVVTISGKYIPLLEVATARSAGYSGTRAELETSAFGSGWRTYKAGRAELTIDLELVEDLLTDHDGGGDTKKLASLFDGATLLFLDVQLGGGGKHLRTWAFLTSASNPVDGDGLVTGSVTARASGHGAAEVASIAE